MKKSKKNYCIYVLMLLLFGGLIYVAIHEGERFSHLGKAPVLVEGSAFDMFRHVVLDNLSHPMSILLIQIIVVLVAVRIFSFLFKYIGQPGVIGEIVAGIVLGPSLLGYFFPEVFGFIFRPDSLTNLELISQIGLILFMFVIGMELDFGVLKNKINETLVISHAGILVPFFLGIVASYWVYEEYAAAHTTFLPFALFIGISMSITAFPVLARIIQERNMTKTPLGILTIASAANDDVTAWCLLAVVIAIAKAGTFASALYAVLFTAIYIVVMFYVIRPFLKKVGNMYANKEVINKTFVSFIFLILILSATTTEIIGIHALFGAFMAGVVMPSNFGFRKVMMEKVEDVSLVFFLPLFFAYTGLHTEIGLIDTPQLWGVCVLLVVVAIAGKFGGCAIAAWLVGESWKDSLTIGTLMNTRGLMELVALNIGYEMGVLPPSIFVILVIMALVTTFMTTPLLALVEKLFLKKEGGAVTDTKKKLLLFFGRPQTGKDLLSIYRLLFGKELGNTQVIAAHYTLGTDLNPAKAEQYAKESFSLIGKEANRLKINVDERYKVTDKLTSEMVKLADDEKVDLLLLGGGYRLRSEVAGDVKSPMFPLITSFMRFIGKKSLGLPGGLFREKIQEIIENVTCPVAVYVNRGSSKVEHLYMVLGGDMDEFLLSYLVSVMENTQNTMTIYLFKSGNEDFMKQVFALVQRYQNRILLKEFVEPSGLVFEKRNSLLLLSYKVYQKLTEDTSSPVLLPSFVTFYPHTPKEEN